MTNKILSGRGFKKTIDRFYDEQNLGLALEKCYFNNEMKVYIASGDMFSQFGQIGLEIIADIFDQIGLDYYLPQRADFNDKTTEDFVITNKMITDGDVEELKTCDFLFAHITDDMDAGLCGEISRFKTLAEHEPERYFGVVGWADDTRLLTTPNPEQQGIDNQVLYLNSFTMGEIENSLGTYYSLGYAILRMFYRYKEVSSIKK